MNKLLTMQKIFVNDYVNNKFDIAVLSGGRGSAKSHVTAGIFCDYIMSQPENTTFGLGMARISNFMEQLDELMRKAVGEGIFKLGGQQRDVLIFPGNRRVQMFSYSTVGQIAKIRGKSWSGCFFEEITLCPQNIYNEALLSTRRDDAKIFITTNPMGPTSYIYRNFFDGSTKIQLKLAEEWYRPIYVYDKKVGDKRVRVYPSQSYDNSDKYGGFIRHGDIQYMEESLPSLAKRRLIYGEWIDAGEEIYNINNLKYYTSIDDELNNSEIIVVIDPSYSGGHAKGNFTSIIICMIKHGNYYIYDTGLVKNNSETYTAKTVYEFITAFENEHNVRVSKIWFEAVMSQADTLKAIREYLPSHDISGFNPKGNKVERMLSMETTVKSRVYFDEKWKQSPKGTSIAEWSETRHGRGYIGLIQLCSFDGVDKGRKYESELSMYDFPDALASLIQMVKPENFTPERIEITESEILQRLERAVFRDIIDDDYQGTSIPIND